MSEPRLCTNDDCPFKKCRRKTEKPGFRQATHRYEFTESKGYFYTLDCDGKLEPGERENANKEKSMLWL